MTSWGSLGCCRPTCSLLWWRGLHTRQHYSGRTQHGSHKGSWELQWQIGHLEFSNYSLWKIGW